MANKLTRRDVAQLIGKTPQYIGVQVKRGKLIEKDKRIDTDNSKNKAFIAKFASRQVIPEAENEESEQVNYEEPNLFNGITPANVDYHKNLKEIELKTVKIAKERLDLDKKKGRLIEIKAATEVMQRAVVVLGSKYRQESKTFLIELASKYNVPDTDIAGLQKWFDNTINKAVIESKDLIVKECEIISDEYSQSLNVGESKS